jgi:exopolysaccharide/PEP-CTERM locus tyrosine autokinase
LIPAEKMPPAEKNDGLRKKNRESFSNPYETGVINKNLISLLDPQCFESEQFKILRTNLFVPVTGKAPRSLIVTSVAPGEGKSFVAANLAISVARAIDRHVLLMDCDLRRPTIHSLFGFGRVQGLSDYLTNGTSLPTLLQRTKEPKLTLLPAGNPPHNPAELLSSERMADLVHEVSERYRDRFIIIDSPPPKLTAETYVLASQVDGVVVVVKYGSTPRDMVAELITRIGKDRILGCVVNYFDVRTPGYRYRYYGKYYGTYTTKKKKSRLNLFSGKKLRKKK